MNRHIKLLKFKQDLSERNRIDSTLAKNDTAEQILLEHIIINSWGKQVKYLWENTPDVTLQEVIKIQISGSITTLAQ